jgi:hypothetical protein
VAPPGSAARIASDVQASVTGLVGDEDGAVWQYDRSDWGRPADAVPQMLWESSAFHFVPFHRKKKTVSPGLTRAAAHSVSPTFAQLNSCMVAPPGRADRIACEEQSALISGPFELVGGLLLGMSLEFGDEVAQAEKARSSPRTGITVKLRRTRLLRTL